MKFFDDAEYIVVASIGGVIGFAMRGKGPKSIKSYAFAGFSAAFVGYITLKVCRTYGVGEDMIGAISGLAGWLGAENALTLIQKYTLEKLGLEGPKKKEDGDADGPKP